MRRLVDEAAVAALESELLVPPPRSASFPDGPTAELRDAMARFSHGDEHRGSRSDVETAIAALDLALLAREVNERTTALAGTGVEAISEIGLVVPTQALLAALHVDVGDVAERFRDVGTVVAAIGRGDPVSPDTEAATRRLGGLFAAHPAGPVAAISMLYQNHDATAALFASTLFARVSGLPRENSLARTVRVATDTVHLVSVAVEAAEVVEAGEVVEVSLDGNDMEFGRGDHACPGQAVAVLIVDAMISSIELLDLTVDVGAAAVGADGRATALPLVE